MVNAEQDLCPSTSKSSNHIPNGNPSGIALVLSSFGDCIWSVGIGVRPLIVSSLLFQSLRSKDARLGGGG